MANEPIYAPQAQKALVGWEHLIKRKAPRDIASVVRAGNRLKALTSTQRTKR